jgi:1,2-diacylglycerol-3-alpha-glucose alpha-1,2-glucosyltransferase
VIPRKGIIDFIKVAENLPQLNFVWFGYRWNKFLAFHPKMHQQIENRPSNVKMPGFFEDAAGAYSAGDVFFFPSYGENQPLVLLETASLGIPPVVRDLSEYGDWLRNGINCLKGQTIKDFTERLIKLSNDRVLWERLSKEQERLAEENRLENVGEKLEKLYSSLLI